MSGNDSDERDELPEKVESEQARVFVATNQAMVIDIRDVESFAEERIFNAERFEPDDVTGRMDQVLADDDDDRGAFLLVCDDGSESAELAERLRGEGYAVSSLEGGFKAWTSDHLPTAPGRDEEYEGPKQAVPGAVASETQADGEDAEEEDGDSGEPGDEGDPDSGDGEDAAAAEAGSEGGRVEPQPKNPEDEEKAERAEDA